MIAEEPVVLAFAGPRIEDSRSLGSAAANADTARSMEASKSST